jgi:SWI/SNF-related matrix-associated actin-dependent regulator of chromatin subfamily A protein 2/4
MTVNSIEERILAAARSKLNMDSKVIQAGLFDNRSTGAERRKFLEQVLTAEVEDDDENEVPDDELVNQMLARSEDEFDTFQRMDIERRRVEAAEFKRRPRLVEDDEVPQQYFKNNELCEQMAAGEIDTEATKALFGQGKRARKEVNYAADLMSEREWLKEYTDEQVEEDEFLEDVS